MSWHRPSILVAFLAWLAPSIALAHVSVVSGAAVANATQEVRFGVGHGCAGADTTRVDVEIPPGVTSVRPLTSDFGQVDVVTDAAGTIVMVSWQKPEAAILLADTQYYELSVRMKPPNEPFTTLFLPTHQTCRAADGTEHVVDWVGLSGSAGTDVEPAPALYLVPQHFPGWNEFTVTTAIDDLDAFFGDAQIVWRGSSAYSINPTTAELIAATDGVTPLTSLGAGHEIWVKY